MVRVEAIAWVTRFLGSDGSGRRTFDEPIVAGDTVRSVLRRLSDRYPSLAEALWDPASGDLGEHVEVLVNDTVLGVRYELDSPVHDGDLISLVGQYTGG
ncbi:MAG: MoaD/ThiS family protein [Chloroflexi bacterium]|nr:MoaD/ThiS family protein [Chloroflexota bacterium]